MTRDVRAAGTWSAALLLPTILLTASTLPEGQGTRGAGGGAQAGAGPAPIVCADTIRDQSGAGCIEASSVPSPGRLFPPPHDGGVNNVASGFRAFVGGGENNSALSPHNTVCGGKENFAGYVGATVGGGKYNRAEHQYATVAGGRGNSAILSGATIGGGDGNGAWAYSATIGGGNENRVTGTGGVVSGGGHNVAGQYATVAGGSGSWATGFYSFAAGRKARATHHGSFVWGDSVDAEKPSSATDEFNVYASGGTRIFSNADATTGVVLAPGEGTWSTLSDRAAKRDLEPVDARAVLERLASLPLWTWSYRSQEEAVRHMGPTAQDFRAAFGLGHSPERIDTVDPDGVALAAIQGLNELVAEQRDEIAALRSRLEELERAEKP